MSEAELLKANLVLRPYGDIELREVALGLTPVILIEGTQDDDGITFDVDATGLSREQLAQVLSAVLHIVDTGVDVE